MWAKIPTATASIACAACIAAAAVAVPAVKSSDGLEKTIASEVNLSAVNFGALAWLSAIPAFEEFAQTGSVQAFRVTDDHPGWDVLSALPLYEDLFSGDPAKVTEALASLDAVSGLPSLLSGDIGGIDAFSAIPIYQELAAGNTDNLNKLESVNALVAFSRFPDEGFDAFVPNEATGNPGYAALSGVSSWQRFFQNGDISENGLGGIDAFSAIPKYQTLLSPDSTEVERANALRNLASVSAIPEYLGLPSEEPAPPAPVAPLSAKVGTESTGTTQKRSESVTPLKQLSSTISSSLPKVNIAPPVAKPQIEKPEALTPDPVEAAAPEVEKSISSSSTTKAKAPAEKTESKGGSYSGVFKPNDSEILFGTGGGKGADNGMRGWGKVLKKIGIGGGGDSGPAGGSEGGGAGGAGGDGAGGAGGGG